MTWKYSVHSQQSYLQQKLQNTGPALSQQRVLGRPIFFFVYLPRSHVLRPSNPSTKTERQELFHRLYRAIPDPKGYMREWFLGAIVQHVTCQGENVRGS
jgi:hypothetical protein